MILQFAEACKCFDGGDPAVDRVSFDVPAGQFCVVLGASGAGKSTLLRMVNGLIEPTSGTVCFHKTQVRPSTWKQIRPRVAMVHQQFNLVPRLSVLKNVLSGALPKISTFAALLGLFPRDYQKRACSLLAEVGLDEKHLYRRAMQLSGGEQQRVAIARAFILEPELVLADEPVASLDPQTSRAILELLRNESRQHGATVLCSLHQIELAIEFADRIVGMSRGKIIFDGPPDKFDDETKHAIYVKGDEDQQTFDVEPMGATEVAGDE